MNEEQKAALLKALEDLSRSFTKAELDTIIYDEFFNGAKAFNMDVVDAALRRKMQLEGLAINKESVQKEREHMIYEVIKEIFKSKE